MYPSIQLTGRWRSGMTVQWLGMESTSKSDLRYCLLHTSLTNRVLGFKVGHGLLWDLTLFVLTYLTGDTVQIVFGCVSIQRLRRLRIDSSCMCVWERHLYCSTPIHSGSSQSSSGARRSILSTSMYAPNPLPLRPRLATVHTSREA